MMFIKWCLLICSDNGMLKAVATSLDWNWHDWTYILSRIVFTTSNLSSGDETRSYSGVDVAPGHVTDGLGDRSDGDTEAESDSDVLGLMGDVVICVPGHAASTADEDLGQEIIVKIIDHCHGDTSDRSCGQTWVVDKQRCWQHILPDMDMTQ